MVIGQNVYQNYWSHHIDGWFPSAKKRLYLYKLPSLSLIIVLINVMYFLLFYKIQFVRLRLCRNTKTAILDKKKHLFFMIINSL